MNWVSFFMGIITVLLTYAFLSSVMGEETEEILIDQEVSVVVNDSSGRFVTLSCQTCRKLKKHREVEPNLYQCMKCKRHVDLR